MTWSGIFIPVLPARLIQALEAPCPYIVGIERRYEKVELPEDDFVLVDLDQDEIESTVQPFPMPKQQRRKLTSLLQLAAPHHNRFGVPKGPPPYAIEAFPYDTFSSENPQIFTGIPQPTHLAKYVGLESTLFGDNLSNLPTKSLVFNAFQQKGEKVDGRPSTSSTAKRSTSPPSPTQSPISGSFPPLPRTPSSHTEPSGGLQSTLREKRSGHFDAISKRSSTYAPERYPTSRRPSLPFSNHSSKQSMATISTSNYAISTYAPSTYAQSTLAASTVMPNVLIQPVRNNENTSWIEGHCLQWRLRDDRSLCSICDDKAEDGIYRCSGCGINAHGRCAPQIALVCPAVFHHDQIRAAFARCFAALFYTYRKHIGPPTREQKKAGMLYGFNMDGFLRSLPHENAHYMKMLQQTQGMCRTESRLSLADVSQHSTSSYMSVKQNQVAILASCSLTK